VVYILHNKYDHHGDRLLVPNKHLQQQQIQLEGTHRVQTMDLWIENFHSNRIIIESVVVILESNQGVIVYVFNADCHRSWAGLLRTTGNYHTAYMNRDVRILRVPQTILHDRTYSASECVCSCYINIKLISITTDGTVKVFCWTVSVVCGTMAGGADSKKFRISPSLSNQIGIVGFKFEFRSFAGA